VRPGDAKVERLESQSRGRTGADQRPGDRADVPGLGCGRRHVDAEHRQAEKCRLEQRLFVETADVRRRREVGELRLNQRLAEREGPRADASCRAKLS
jgi:hypothetical protein